MIILPDIKFGFINQKWPLNVLLDNKSTLLSTTLAHGVQDVFQLHVQADAPPPGGGPWFDDPNVHESIHNGLWSQFQNVVQGFATLIIELFSRWAVIRMRSLEL